MAQARLAGDARSKAEAQGWLPVCASLGSAVLAGRGPRPSPLSSPGAPPIRTAIGPPEGSGAAALLALDLLDIPALALPGNPATLWQEGNAQALLLSGAEVPQRLAALGATPWCVLDAERDPELPETPTLAELAPGAPPPLLAACRAASAAARLLSALVLPALTPADQVALWRNATQRWVEEEARAGIPANGQALPGAEAAALLAAALAPPDVVLAYREWLLRRLGWQGER